MKRHKKRADITQSTLTTNILFVLFLLVVYRLGSHIPLPGVNINILNQMTQYYSRGIFGTFNVLTGGSLGRMSILTLNIMPYITASILMQLFSILFKELAELKKSGSEGRKKIDLYARCFAVFIAMVQGYGIAKGLESFTHNGIVLVENVSFLFRLVAVLCLVSGTVIMMWFADQINTRKLGNGSSIIIFVSIVSGLIPSFISLLQMARDSIVSIQFVFLALMSLLVIVALIVLIETAERRITIYHPRKQVGNKIYSSNQTYLPLKLNIAGVIPPIFANSLLLFPVMVVGFQKKSFLQPIVENYLVQGKPLYIFFDIILIFFFCYFYGSIVFNSKETADNLRKTGSYIVGVRPGVNTSKYLTTIVNKLAFVGATYISFICVIPEFIITQCNIPLYIGGTSILIVISVVLELSTKIRVYLLNQKYKHLSNRVNIMMLG